jgi:hypothetical protein
VLDRGRGAKDWEAITVVKLCEEIRVEIGSREVHLDAAELDY